MRAAILLAAGRSRRFGRADKLLARIGRTRVFERALAVALASDARRVILVSTQRNVRLFRRTEHRDRVRIVVARDAASGMSRSLAAGLRALRPIEREAWIFLGDMPAATAPRGVRLRAGEQAARPWVNGLPAHPMLVRTAAARRRLGAGDRGLGKAFPDDVVRRLRGNMANLLDIDDRAALSRFRLRR